MCASSLGPGKGAHTCFICFFHDAFSDFFPVSMQPGQSTARRNLTYRSCALPFWRRRALPFCIATRLTKSRVYFGLFLSWVLEKKFHVRPSSDAFSTCGALRINCVEGLAPPKLYCGTFFFVSAYFFRLQPDTVAKRTDFFLTEHIA